MTRKAVISLIFRLDPDDTQGCPKQLIIRYLMIEKYLSGCAADHLVVCLAETLVRLQTKTRTIQSDMIYTVTAFMVRCPFPIVISSVLMIVVASFWDYTHSFCLNNP